MDIDESIKNRHSIRSYLPNKDITEEDVMNLVKAGYMAPSPGNLHNWFMFIVTNKDVKNKIAEAAFDQLWVSSAPVIIVIASEEEKVKNIFQERGQIYSNQSVGMAAENMLLKATSMGIASCFVSAFNPERIKNILETGLEPSAIITLGYTREKKDLNKEFDIPNLRYRIKWVE